MGMFLALAGVIGKSQTEVEKSLLGYLQSTGGSFIREAMDQDHEDWSVIGEANGNTTVYYPNSLMQWDKVSEHLSRDLNTAVFSCHIHDGDLWMYVLFVNGRTEDQFNPIPDYWEELDEAEINRWRGNATTVAQHVPGLKPASIAKYLTRSQNFAIMIFTNQIQLGISQDHINVIGFNLSTEKTATLCSFS